MPGPPPTPEQQAHRISQLEAQFDVVSGELIRIRSELKEIILDCDKVCGIDTASWIVNIKLKALLESIK